MGRKGKQRLRRGKAGGDGRVRPTRKNWKGNKKTRRTVLSHDHLVGGLSLNEVIEGVGPCGVDCANRKTLRRPRSFSKVPPAHWPINPRRRHSLSRIATSVVDPQLTATTTYFANTLPRVPKDLPRLLDCNGRNCRRCTKML